MTPRPDRTIGIISGLALALAWPMPALAHGRPVPAPGDAWRAWAWDSPMLPFVVAMGMVYAGGALALRGRAGGKAVPRWRVACYGLGLLAMVLALVSPIEAIAGGVFTAHMIQHLLLTIVAAPLIALAAPLAPMLWAFPAAWRRGLVTRGQRTPGARLLWRRLTHPIGAWLAFAVATWAWHIPALYEAALASAFVHTLEHAAFFVTALLFWWVTFRAARRPRNGGGVAVLMTLTTMIQTGLLGALLTFASAPLYMTQSTASAMWGLTPLEDQQLAGVIMWIPPGFVYTVAGCWLLARWIERDVAKPTRGADHRIPATKTPVGIPAP